VVSNPIQVTANMNYTLKAVMRYNVGSGGSAQMSVIEIDSNGKTVNEIHQVYSNGGWQWHENINSFKTTSSTSAIAIRFGIGGENGSYLDLDRISFFMTNESKTVSIFGKNRSS
jgi:hypothetical protein